MDFTVTFIIDPNDLDTIKDAKQRITLAKPVTAEDPTMIWLALDPFPKTEVGWKEEYGIYASTTGVQHGAQAAKMDETDIPSQDGAFYTLTANNHFAEPPTVGRVPRGTFGAQNDVPHSSNPALTFGLTQTPIINQSPLSPKTLSAESVLATQFVKMTPFTIVYAWLQSDFASETMITEITGTSAKIRLGGENTNATLKYNADLGAFLPSSPQGNFLSEHPNIELLVPAKA